MNEAASALGKMGRGKKKTITESERQRRRDWMKTARTFRKDAPQKPPAPDERPGPPGSVAP